LILTSKSTASASEPFVYTLQKENIATVIGEKTAGAVISMEYFHLQNLALTIPMLDYYTYDGKRLDKIGVEPNIKCDPKEALDVALRKIDGK
jgi:C-terminal processing protease CtpA/Prc